MRFQVPQFVYVEDKVIGPFTLKQFFMYIGAAMVLVPVYIFSDLSLFITVAIPVAGTAAAFAHFKINNKSLFTVITNALGYYTSSPVYVWQRTNKLQPLKITDPAWDEIATASQLGEKASPLAAQLRALETSGNVVNSDDVADALDPEATP
ncbi:MAG: PrgI family protein [Candidatus Andersenbacteria bacterium]